MKKILYATDFSEKAAKAFDYALELAHKNDAELLMLHIYKNDKAWNYPYLTDGVAFEKKAILEAKKNLRKLFQLHAKNNGKNVKVNYLVKANISAVFGIISVIVEHKPDLLVVGTRGASKKRELMFGSTTRDLTKNSPCPLLIIPQKAPVKAFKNIVYASDFFENDVKAITQMLVLLKNFAPSVTITHVSPQEENTEGERMEKFKKLVQEMTDYEKIGFNSLLSDDFYEVLNNYISYYGINLLVMLEKERKGFIDQWFQSDHITKMEFQTSTPLLIFNERYLDLYPEKSLEEVKEVKSQ